MKICEVSLSKTTLLIDADLYLYQACSAAEEEVDWGDDIWSLWTDLKVAKGLFEDRLEEFKKRLQVDEVLLCFTTGHNWRKDIYETYKGNRKKTRKPVGYAAAVEWASEKWPTCTQDGLEADDVMGILQTANPRKTVIVSDDKDMKTIPGKLYRPMNDELLEVSATDADQWFLMQCLMGDATDGYPGCKGVGEKTAARILGNYGSWEMVAEAYHKKEYTREEAIVQSQCARILRNTDWDSVNQKVIPWRP